MGPIQSNINQILGTATIGAGLYAQSPMGKRMTELRQIKVSTGQIRNQIGSAIKVIEQDGDVDNLKANIQYLDELYPKGAELTKRRFELQPTAENFKKYQSYIKHQSEYESWRPSFPQAKAADKAEDSMQNAIASKLAQKDLISQFKDMSKEDRTAFLRESQHYQAQQKRGGK